MPAGLILNTTNQFSEGMGATGYVTISVIRDGQEIYHAEDHNQITEAGIDFFIQQISGTSTSTPASFIGLTTTDITPDDDDTSLTSEITTGGLERAVGAVNHTPTGTDDDDNYTITKTFTASATHTAVQGAGLFTDATVGGDTMVAINEFTAVTLQSGDTLAITWTIDFGPNPALDA